MIAMICCFADGDRLLVLMISTKSRSVAAPGAALLSESTVFPAFSALSSGLLISRSQVRILPGMPFILAKPCAPALSSRTADISPPHCVLERRTSVRRIVISYPFELPGLNFQARREGHPPTDLPSDTDPLVEWPTLAGQSLQVLNRLHRSMYEHLVWVRQLT